MVNCLVCVLVVFGWFLCKFFFRGEWDFGLGGVLWLMDDGVMYRWFVLFGVWIGVVGVLVC